MSVYPSWKFSLSKRRGEIAVHRSLIWTPLMEAVATQGDANLPGTSVISPDPNSSKPQIRWKKLH